MKLREKTLGVRAINADDVLEIGNYKAVQYVILINTPDKRVLDFHQLCGLGPYLGP